MGKPPPSSMHTELTHTASAWKHLLHNNYVMTTVSAETIDAKHIMYLSAVSYDVTMLMHVATKGPCDAHAPALLFLTVFEVSFSSSDLLIGLCRLQIYRHRSSQES